jgi:hypothetical protein
MSGLMPKPKSSPTITMPDPDNEAVREERRKRARDVAGKSGRASTFMSDAASGTYSGDKLG